MRIIVDMQGAQTDSRFRGIGRYTLSLVESIARNNKKHEVILVLNGAFPETIEEIRTVFNRILPQDNIRLWYAPESSDKLNLENNSLRKIAELIREAFMLSLQPDVVLITSPFEGYCDNAVVTVDTRQSQYKNVSILYDLIPLVYPEHYLDVNPNYKAFYETRLLEVKRSDAFLTISERTTTDATAFLGLPPSFITNISAACDPKFHKKNFNSHQEEEIKKRFGIDKSFVLFTGGADYRKNLHRMIRIFSKVSIDVRSKHQLLIVGKMPVQSERELKALIEDLGFQDGEVILSGHVSDDDLCSLYNLCCLYLFPSLYEGFGLPVLEAMECGAPVIASNSSSLIEIVDYEEAMFDPEDDEDILHKLNRALVDPVFIDDLIKNGQKQSVRFSWDKTANIALNFLERYVNDQSVKVVNFAQFQSNNISHLIDDISKHAANLSEKELKKTALAIAFNHPERHVKTIFVDISELVKHDAATGVQRVTKNILYQLLVNPPEGYCVEAVYASMNEVGYRSASRWTKNFLCLSGDKEDDLIEPTPGDIFLGLDLQHHVTGMQAEYLEAIKNYGVLIYFVIYDLLPIQFPEFFPEATMSKIHSEWLRVISQFDGAICISRSVADELIIWLDANVPKRNRPFNVGWFHLGADINKSLSTQNQAPVIDVNFPERLTFLMVGTIEPRKGYTQTLNAFDLLWDAGFDINLVVVGKKGWLVELLIEKIENHPKKDCNLFWFEGVNDNFLEAIYGKSNCLIAASEGEGFGLPLIEAAAHDLPIIAREIPIFREVAGDYATYYTGDKPEDLSDAIENWMHDLETNKNHKKPRLNYLTWSQRASQLGNVIVKNNWYQEWPLK